MRTTVDIPDATYRLLKSKAAAEGGTVKQLLLRGAETVLNEPAEAQEEEFIPRLSEPLVRGGTPGSVPLLTNAELYDLIDFP